MWLKLKNKVLQSVLGRSVTSIKITVSNISIICCETHQVTSSIVTVSYFQIMHTGKNNSNLYKDSRFVLTGLEFLTRCFVKYPWWWFPESKLTYTKYCNELNRNNCKIIALLLFHRKFRHLSGKILNSMEIQKHFRNMRIPERTLISFEMKQWKNIFRPTNFQNCLVALT